MDTAAGTSLYNLGRTIGLHVLSAQKASGYLEITGMDGIIIPVGFLAGTPGGIKYAVLAEGIIRGGYVTLPARAVNMGTEGNALAGTIVQIVSPIEGVTGVTNPSDFTGGKYRETDEEFRDRYYKSVDFAGGVNADAIRAEILQNVENVSSAAVYENDFDHTDERGLPPHSIHCIVYGGLDADIAQQIYRRKAAGIQTFGAITVSVIGTNGQTYNIKFNRPRPAPVYVKIRELATNKFFPNDGVQKIKDAIIGYIGGNVGVAGGKDIGENLYFYELAEPIYSVPGVVDFDYEISPDGENFSREDIIISSMEKLVCDIGNIQVEVLG